MVIYNLEQLSGDKLIDEDKEALKLGLTYGKLEDKQLTYAYRKHDQYLSLAAWKQRADERWAKRCNLCKDSWGPCPDCFNQG